jgi:hypothetical protein
MEIPAMNNSNPMKIKLGLVITVALMNTPSGFAFSPSECGITNKIGTPALNRYCTRLRKKSIDADPGHGLIGKLEKAAHIEGEPASQHYYWITTKDGAHTYFDANSAIGRTILKECKGYYPDCTG